MPRISNLTNFDGEVIATQPWVLSKLQSYTPGGGGGGTNSAFVKDTCNTEDLASYMASLSASTGDIVVIQAGTAKGNYIFVNSNGAYVKLIDETSTSGDLTELSTRVSGVEADITAIVNKVDGSYKIKTSVLPDIAITRVYTVNASSASNINKTINALLAAALGENTAQTGDMIIITAETQERAEQVAGNYIITNDVEEPGDISNNDYVKMYAGTGSVISVNGVAPVAGNVQLSIENLDDFTITYTEVEGVKKVNTISVKNVEIAKKSDLTPITEKISEIEQDISEFNSVQDDINDINNQITLVKQQQTNNIAAINKAVELYETTVRIENGEAGVTVDTTLAQDGVTVISKRVTVITSGRILQVWDAGGKTIVPDITYSGSVTMLTATYNKSTIDTQWTMLRSLPIQVEIATSTNS